MPDLCKCGCGREIVIKPWHKSRGVPKYLHGHFKSTLGKVMSEETKKKISDSRKGTPAWNAGKKGIYSEETLNKIKAARAKQVMKKGRKHSEESKEKNRIAHLGKHSHTEESRIKLSLAAKGRKLSKEQKHKISTSKIGEKNPNWLGGVSKVLYGQDWTEDVKDAIRKRDGYACQICGMLQSDLAARLQKKLAVHHIDYDKKNSNPDNLVTLCISCHNKTGRHRDSWKMFFNNNLDSKLGNSTGANFGN